MSRSVSIPLTLIAPVFMTAVFAHDRRVFLFALLQTLMFSALIPIPNMFMRITITLFLPPYAVTASFITLLFVNPNSVL